MPIPDPADLGPIARWNPEPSPGLVLWSLDLPAETRSRLIAEHLAELERRLIEADVAWWIGLPARGPFAITVPEADRIQALLIATHTAASGLTDEAEGALRANQ